MCQIEPFKEQVNINIILPDKPGPNSTGLTIFNTVVDTYPNAQTCNNLLNSYLGQNHVSNANDAELDEEDAQPDEEDAQPDPKTPVKCKKIKPTKHTLRRSALLSTAVAFTTVLDYFNVFGHAQCEGCKLLINNDAPGATFAPFTATSMTCAMADTFAYNAAFSPPEPHSQQEARQRPDSAMWKKEENKEVSTLWDMQTFQVVDKPKAGYDPLPLRFVYKLKMEDGDFDKAIYKARLVMRGNLQYESEYGDTYAPTAKLWTIRTLAALAEQEGFQLKKFNLTCAFLVADMDRTLYVEIPGYELPEGKALLLKKALYGGRSSGTLYAKEISTWLKDYGFQPTSVDETLFKLQRGRDIILLSLYVDNGACATNSEALYKQFITDLQAKYKLSDQGDLKWHLGMKFARDKKTGSISIDQLAYIEHVLKRFSMDNAHANDTQLPPHIHLSKSDCPETPDKEAVQTYQQLIRSLMYIACGTRPDIAYAVNTCAQFMSNPGPAHIHAAKHILRYLKGTSNVGLTYSKQPKEVANRLYGSPGRESSSSWWRFDQFQGLPFFTEGPGSSSELSLI